MKFYGFLLIFTAFLSVSTLAAIIQVPGDQPDIQAGIDAALDGDTVLVADGTYTGDGNRDISFNGKAITVMSQNGAESCVIDCQGTSAEQHRGISFISNENESSVLTGFTIKNTCIENPHRGGGILIADSAPQIVSCVLVNNQAFEGGGILLLRSSPKIISCQFIGNWASEGGGIKCGSESTPIIENCDFIDNFGIIGGGIFCKYSSPNIIDCDISCNSSGFSGGGILCISSNPSIENCNIQENIANNGAEGGGIACRRNSNPTIKNCFISKNISQTGYGCGISCESYSSLIMENCLILRNQGLGGCIYCTDGAYVTMFNCSILKNSATIDTGGILCTDDSGCKIVNSIIWDNGPDWEPDQFGNADITYSDLEFFHPGLGNISINPEFKTDNPHYSFDPRLSPDSPCIDAGTDRSAPDHDLDGNVRPAGGAVDLGAYEFDGWPNTIRSYVSMPDHQLSPGDIVFVDAKIWNAGLNTLRDYPFWVILDLYGQLYFAPDFDGVNCYSQEFPPGLTQIPVLPPFIWPEGIESAEGILWYAALTNPEINEIVGEMGVFDFGWSE